ncbi:hypothetical protein [Arthrobacter sp. TWP1-1]|uniref:hypothetical protein n=1 Tax=Arthrobacter sp. TWP1-1 TaxID=2804568 RepID=UPI003CE8EA53
MWKRKAVAGLVLAGGMVLAQTAGAQAAPAQHPLEGTDPLTTGCNVGAYVVKAWDIFNVVYGEVQGLAQLVYSPSCGTNWVNVYGFTAGNNYSVVISNNYNGGGFDASAGGGGSAATLQTYAPGDTCVTVDWSVQDIATGNGEGSGRSLIC